MNNLDNYKETIFEKLKKLNEYGSEYLLARDLAEALEYSQWRNFVNGIDKAKEACTKYRHQRVVFLLVTILGIPCLMNIVIDKQQCTSKKRK